MKSHECAIQNIPPPSENAMVSTLGSVRCISSEFGTDVGRAYVVGKGELVLAMSSLFLWVKTLKSHPAEFGTVTA